MNGQEKLTPMLRQFREIKDKHPDKLLLFRMGDFYETFFEDAALAARILGLTLTTRDKKEDGAVPLAGFPHHALDNYLHKLIRAGIKVVVADQLEDPKLAKGLVKRGITDIITPGTVMDPALLDTEGSYLAALYRIGPLWGLAGLEAASGDFFYMEGESPVVLSELSTLQPQEICLSDHNLDNDLPTLRAAISYLDDPFFGPESAGRILAGYLGQEGRLAPGEEAGPGLTAAALALQYLESLKSTDLRHISSLNKRESSRYLIMDETSRRNLELIKTLRDGTRSGSLLDVMDTTCSPMGSRLMQTWITHPLTDREELLRRQNRVETFINNSVQLDNLRDVLRNMGDLGRLAGRVATGKIMPRECLSLARWLGLAPKIVAVLMELEGDDFADYWQEIPFTGDICQRINTTLSDDPAPGLGEGGIIAHGFSAELDDLRLLSMDGKSSIAALEAEERQKTGISTLKVGYNKVFGYYLEVTNANRDKIPEGYIRKQTLVNGERYISPLLKDFEGRVLGAEERIRALEQELYGEMRRELADWSPQFSQLVQVAAELDVLASFAHNARIYNYHRPEFCDTGEFWLEESRHPVVERLLPPGTYIPNDVLLNQEDRRIALITGPNMAGKSTYLRQAGLLALMAQCGSYVPAAKARMPIFDRIFTRVGASDNLAQGQSTFLVEMLETANILKNATPQSLVLLDEIGRGTATFDGLSLAWAIVEYLHNNPRLKCRTLFATHYHELTELENVLPGVKNLNVAVKEYNDEMIFLRRIEPGGADRSYGVQVARLAGLPEPVLKRARQILKNLEESELSPQGPWATARRQLLAEKGSENEQMNVFEVLFAHSDKDRLLVEELRSIDINTITPLQAMQILADLHQKASAKDE